MNGCLRALTVFHKRGIPDRVPWMEQVVSSDVASAIMGREMHTGGMPLWKAEANIWMDGDAAHSQWLDTVLRDLVEFCRHMGIDCCAPPWRLGQKPFARIDENTFLFDNGAVMWQYDPQSGAVGWKRLKGKEPVFDDIPSIVASAERSAAESSPTPEGFREYLQMRELAGEDALIAGRSFLSVPIQPHFLEAVALAPDLIERWLDAAVESNIKEFRLQKSLGFSVLNGGGDLADNRGTVYSPKFFHDIVAPRYARKVKAAHDMGFCYIFRSDGKIWSIADELFGLIGCDAFGEIDIDAGMDLIELHRRYPDLVLWGGLSCGRLLRLGKPQQVKDEARRLIDTIGRDGRLVIGSSNSIMPGTPPANILALRDVIME
ncbi:MAG TPA: uroporphyrinogen decarboxylase family protein [Candidatus Brocadiia bacterium]|nr:uroporphyrinogen decarboxylase family protein [Candidatus Brocadiia bacterium]